jgi:hypothetical protein
MQYQLVVFERLLLEPVPLTECQRLAAAGSTMLASQPFGSRDQCPGPCPCDAKECVASRVPSCNQSGFPCSSAFVTYTSLREQLYASSRQTIAAAQHADHKPNALHQVSAHAGCKVPQ